MKMLNEEEAFLLKRCPNTWGGAIREGRVMIDGRQTLSFIDYNACMVAILHKRKIWSINGICREVLCMFIDGSFDGAEEIRELLKDKIPNIMIMKKFPIESLIVTTPSKLISLIREEICKDVTQYRNILNKYKSYLFAAASISDYGERPIVLANLMSEYDRCLKYTKLVNKFFPEAKEYMNINDKVRNTIQGIARKRTMDANKSIHLDKFYSRGIATTYSLGFNPIRVEEGTLYTNYCVDGSIFNAIVKSYKAMKINKRKRVTAYVSDTTFGVYIRSGRVILRDYSGTIRRYTFLTRDLDKAIS